MHAWGSLNCILKIIVHVCRQKVLLDQMDFQYYEDRAIVNFIATDFVPAADYFNTTEYATCNYDCRTSTNNGNLFDSHVILNLLVAIVLVVNILLIFCFWKILWKLVCGFNSHLIKKIMAKLNKFYLICIPLFPIVFDNVITSLIFSLNTYSKMHIITISIKLFIVILLPLVEFTCLCGCKYYYKENIVSKFSFISS